MKKITIYFIVFSLLVFVSKVHGSVSIARYTIQETIEIASRVSGKTLNPAARKLATEELEKWAIKYGDDAIRATEKGGLELLEAASKYGDDVWHLSSKVPQATRALAVRADELIPMTKRIGTEVLELEARIPGIAEKIVEHFGDDAVKYLAHNVSPEDLTRLTGYAAKADSPATKALLYEKYKEAGTHFLDKLDYKQILAGGLSIAAITAAYEVSKGERIKSEEIGKGMGKGYEEVAKNNPDVFVKGARSNTSDFLDVLYILVIVLVVGIISIILLKFYKIITTKQN